MKKLKARQLTKNEKILFILLGIIVLSWISYGFIYTPQIKKINTLSIEKSEYKTAIEDINSTLRKEKVVDSEWKELNIKKEKIVSSYFPTLDQAQIIYILNDLISYDDIEIQDMSFSRPSAIDFEDFQVNSMDIFIPYNGDYQGVVSVLDSIKNSPRKITVDSLSMDRGSQNSLNGNITLKVYSLEGITEAEKDIVYIDTSSVKEKDNPFSGYKNYDDKIIEDDDRHEENIVGEIKESDELNPYIKKTLLDFETNNSYFIPSKEFIKGDVSLSTNSKSEKYSLKIEYNIIAIEEKNIAFVDVTKNNILLKYPPNRIGIWMHSYDYSPVTFGIAFRGQMGEDILIPFTEGIGWTGWKYIETKAPENLSIYPLKLERLYIEIAKDRDDYGIFLIDKLQVLYDRNIDEDGNDSSIGDYSFHVINQGDTLDNISERYYGSKMYNEEIRKLNEINSGEILQVGKVLVLKKH